jgi:hypothetical protein
LFLDPGAASNFTLPPIKGAKAHPPAAKTKPEMRRRSSMLMDSFEQVARAHAKAKYELYLHAIASDADNGDPFKVTCAHILIRPMLTRTDVSRLQ